MKGFNRHGFFLEGDCVALGCRVVGVVFLVVCVSLAFYTNVSTDLTDDDRLLFVFEWIFSSNDRCDCGKVKA